MIQCALEWFGFILHVLFISALWIGIIGGEVLLMYYLISDWSKITAEMILSGCCFMLIGLSGVVMLLTFLNDDVLQHYAEFKMWLHSLKPEK
ncbi:MAG: hypothetical protein ACOZBH_03000 [Patescibacteria group bacterium]